jgi:hypothetical protein
MDIFLKKVVLPIFLGLVLIAVVVMSMLYSAEYSDRIAAWIYDKFVAAPPPASTGLAVSVVTTFLGLVYVLVTQNRTKRGLVRRYRWAEQTLMELDRERTLRGASRQGEGFRRDMLNYHSSFHWYSYAGLGFQSVFLIVVLFDPQKLSSMPHVKQVGVFLGLALLGISTVIFGFTDFFHTNTLSPLVTTKRRMVLISIIVMLGGFSYLLQICSVGIFLALINPWLSLFSSLTGVALMILITEMRGVPILELKEERDLSEDEMLKVMSS